MDDAIAYVGRRSNDGFRKAVLNEVLVGQIAGRSRSKTGKAIEENLRSRSIKGFRDKAGREWSLTAYAKMAANANTSEAHTVATLNRLAENGVDLLKVPEHPHDVWSKYEGRVFSISWTSGEYPPLEEAPPYHPFCRHLLTAYIRGLAGIVGITPAPGAGSSGGGAGGGGGGTGGDEPLGPDDPRGPNHEWFRRAIIDPAKFERFLFVPEHPQNRGKAEGWRRVFGLGPGDAALVARLIRGQLERAPIEEVEPQDVIEHPGMRVRRWRLVIPDFRGPNGNVAPLVTTWALHPARKTPHMTTAFPRTSRRGGANI